MFNIHLFCSILLWRYTTTHILSHNFPHYSSKEGLFYGTKWNRGKRKKRDGKRVYLLCVAQAEQTKKWETKFNKIKLWQRSLEIFHFRSSFLHILPLTRLTEIGDVKNWITREKRALTLVSRFSFTTETGESNCRTSVLNIKRQNIGHSAT
jgi:hypothetical protein